MKPDGQRVVVAEASEGSEVIELILDGATFACILVDLSNMGDDGPDSIETVTELRKLGYARCIFRGKS